MGDGESPLSLPNTGDDPYRVWWATYFQMGGTPIVNDDGTEVTLDTDKAVEAAEFVKSLYDDGYIATGIDDHQKLFQSGKAAFMFTGTWAVGVMESTDGLNFNVQSFPQLFDEDHCWADSHTFILPVNGDRDEDETKALMQSTSGEFGGIGALFSQDKDTKVITFLFMFFHNFFRIG